MNIDDIDALLAIAIAFTPGLPAALSPLTSWGMLPARFRHVFWLTVDSLLLVGFVMFMISGVALWMFPRPAKGDDRYRPWLAEWAYWLLLAGTAGRAALELTASPNASVATRAAIVTAGAVQLAGLLLFFVMMLPRIRSTLSEPR